MDPTTRRFVELTYAPRWLSVYDQNVDKGRSPRDALRAVEVGVAEGKAVMLGGNRRERRARASRRRKAKR